MADLDFFLYVTILANLRKRCAKLSLLLVSAFNLNLNILNSFFWVDVWKQLILFTTVLNHVKNFVICTVFKVFQCTAQYPFHKYVYFFLSLFIFKLYEVFFIVSLFFTGSCIRAKLKFVPKFMNRKIYF